jgi:2',3'-cyclic-nucleotide 2'-phosphodiesterase (5'-nucleotidase family)
MGGLARRANAIEAVRRERADVLLFDGGNCWWGAPGLSRQSQARLNVEAMNLMEYHAMALGASDLALGEVALSERIAEADFAVLSANVFVPTRGELLGRPYVVLEVSGRRIGVIGITASSVVTTTLESGSLPTMDPYPGSVVSGASRLGTWINDDLVVLDPGRGLQRYAGKLAESADIIVVLSNLGWPANVELAGRVSEVDLIISAGAAADLQTKPWQAPSGVWLCQAGVSGQKRPGEMLAEVYLSVDGSGHITQARGSQTVLSPQMKNNSRIIELFQRYRGQ